MHGLPPSKRNGREMYDTIIRGGTIVDGLGGPPYTADIAIAGGNIAELGSVTGTARQEIDADGAVVTPGFIDVHTHYDGQFLWDDKIDPSFSPGLTPAIAGICGVGLAPASREHRRELMDLMEGVEDIPGIVMDEGLDWNWTTFNDYLDRLSERKYTLDVASHITHAPLRVFVMGERALTHEPATPDDIEAMAVHVRAAMDAGAVGFSAGRLLEHSSRSGGRVPGTITEAAELFGLAKAMGESGRGVFQIIPKGAVGSVMGADGLAGNGRLAEHSIYEEICRVSRRPLTYSIAELESDPEDIRQMIAASDKANAQGASLHPQIAARGIGGFNMLGAYHAFVMKPSYREIAHLPPAEQAKARRQPARRAAILSEENVEGEFGGEPLVLPMLKRLVANVGKTFILESNIGFEPGPDRRVASLAAAAGKTAEEFIYDHYADGDGRNYNVSLVLNYARCNLDHVYDLFQNRNVISGLGDGGAHVKSVCDSSMTTYQLAYWTRDRTRGPRIPLELLVRKLTSDLADLWGFHDRGAITVGKRADINVLDYDRLTVNGPYVANDLPSGAARILQGSQGYLATMVAGEVTRRHDVDTGARPGRLAKPGLGQPTLSGGR